MKVSLTVNQLLGLEKPTSMLLQSKMSFANARKVNKLYKCLAEEFTEIYKERDKILRKYYQNFDEQGMPTNKLSEEKQELFNKEITDFMGTLLEDLEIALLPEEIFTTMNISPVDLLALEPLIEQKKEEEG